MQEVIETSSTDNEQSIIVQGCKFDSETIENSDFAQNTFTLTLSGLVNPQVRKDSADIKIEIYQQYDKESNELSLLADTGSF